MGRKLLLVFASVVTGVLLVTAILQAQGSPMLYVVNSLSEELSVIDMDRDAVVGTIPLGAPAYQIATAPGGALAYITTSSQGLPGQRSPYNSGLAVVDLTTRKVVRRIAMPVTPLSGIHLHPKGKEAYVVSAGEPGARNTARGQVQVVSLADGKVTRSIAVGLNPLDSAITPDGRFLYTADWASRAVSVVNLSDGRLQDSVPLGQHATRCLVMRPDGKNVYIALERLAVSPVQTQQFNATANMSNMRTQTTMNNMFVPDDAPLLWAVDTQSGAISKLPLHLLNPIYTMTLAPDGRTLYLYGKDPATSAPDVYNLLAFDLEKRDVSKRYGNYGYLSTMPIHPAGTKLYLIGTPGDDDEEALTRARYTQHRAAPTSNEAQMAQILTDLKQLKKTVTVLDLETGKTLKTLTVGALPQGAAVVK